uniref:starch synthase n=1 Tax=Vitis vinifera TaxID=29760 RepID=A5BHQ6_VITVI|nr:hypothetical protein VITISV_027826 [Vitis vinifera]
MDVSLEFKSLPSVGYSRKSYLQTTSQRLARGKLVHLHGRRSLALPSVGPGSQRSSLRHVSGSFRRNSIALYKKAAKFSQQKADFATLWSDLLAMAVTPSFQLRIAHRLKHWILDFLSFEMDENVRFIDKCDEALSHLIFAGSDIILCPSFHDPMLQVPLKAMRYGAAPIAITSIGKRFRHVVDHDFQSTKLSQFLNTTFAYMSLNEALDEIKSNSMQWNQKIMDAMTKDFSWDAECYDIHISAYTALKNL